MFPPFLHPRAKSGEGGIWILRLSYTRTCAQHSAAPSYARFSTLPCIFERKEDSVYTLRAYMCQRLLLGSPSCACEVFYASFHHRANRREDSLKILGRISYTRVHAFCPRRLSFRSPHAANEYVMRLTLPFTPAKQWRKHKHVLACLKCP